MRKSLDPNMVWAQRWERRIVDRTKAAPEKEDTQLWYTASAANVDILHRMLQKVDLHCNRRGAGMKIAEAAMRYVDRSSVPMTEHTSLLLVVVATLVALKVDDDLALSNATWAECVGLTLQELNALERDFCASVDWRLWLSPPGAMQSRKRVKSIEE